jgi:uncharacterized protein (DUF427 family)
MTANRQSNRGPCYTQLPDHRIEIEAPPRRVRVMLDGVPVADSTDALLMRESGYDPVWYFPREDVTGEVLGPTERTTYCPFKGEASYWTLRAGGHEIENAAWSYETPYDEVEAIKGRLTFYPDKIDALLEG